MNRVPLIAVQDAWLRTTFSPGTGLMRTGDDQPTNISGAFKVLFSDFKGAFNDRSSYDIKKLQF